MAHAEFGDIALSELQKSFASILPWSLSYAAMFERWIASAKKPLQLITYGETLAPIRPVYARTKALSPASRWISIQHATIYRNKPGFYHRRSEFCRASPDDLREISPKPDMYLVHGPQAEAIVGEFLPSELIRAIGCLKYDRLFRTYGARPPRKATAPCNKTLLLAPSVGDEEVILRMFAGLESIRGWRVVLSKHPAVSEERIRAVLQRNSVRVPLEFGGGKSTIELVGTSDLVVCSYSSIAFEARFLGVPSLRIMDPERPPMVEDEPGIPYLTDQNEFLRVLAAVAGGGALAAHDPEIDRTLDRYFLHFDGKASMRFWRALRATSGDTSAR